MATVGVEVIGAMLVACCETRNTGYRCRVIKEQDILVMLAALCLPERSTVRAIGAVAGLDAATTHRSLRRLEAARIWSAARGTVDRRQAHELLVHGVKFMFPVQLGAVDRGRRAAWGRSPLAERLAQSGETPVWPDPHGAIRGPSLSPLHRGLLAQPEGSNPRFEELVSIVDSLRAGDARIRGLAVEALDDRLLGEASQP